jgi:hypothetical protein
MFSDYSSVSYHIRWKYCPSQYFSGTGPFRIQYASGDYYFYFYFPNNGSIVTIDQISSDNHHPSSTLFQVSPLYVPGVRVDSSPPQVNYMASYPWYSIACKKEPL